MEAKAEVEAEKEIENRDVEEETNEVEFLEEVEKKEKEEKEVIERRKERKDVRGNVDPWGPTDRRIKEVKAKV